MKLLVTGGGGYIGSFMVRALCERGDKVYVLDSFERGFRDAVDKRSEIIEGDLLDQDFVKNTFDKISLDAVIHFAGLISVAESVIKPGIYFESNIMGALNILDSIKEKNLKFIFSSTAAVYGNPIEIPIPEIHPKNPTSPYGVSKLMVEDILKWYNQLFGQRYVALRYFNASGAALDGSMGERHIPETHIIPIAIEAALYDREFSIYGNDYDTRDKTCERDYIHVLDLVTAHILALESGVDQAGAVFNVGSGHGFTNREVVEMVEKVSGKKINISEKDRRPGDPARLIADASKIFQELNFKPKHSDLETIVRSAYLWHTQKA